MRQVLLCFLLLCYVSGYAAGTKIKITKTALEAVLNSYMNAGAFSSGQRFSPPVGDGSTRIEYVSFGPKECTVAFDGIDKLILTTNANIYCEGEIFSFDIDNFRNRSLNIYCNILTERIDLNNDGILENYLVLKPYDFDILGSYDLFSIEFWINHYGFEWDSNPPIPAVRVPFSVLTSNQIFDPNAVPTVAIANNSIELGFELKLAPPVIQAVNKIAGYENIGNIEHYNSATSSWNSYSSANAFFDDWAVNSSHQIRTPVKVLPANSQQHLYKKFVDDEYSLDDDSDSEINPIAERTISIITPNQDKKFSARFNEARHLTINNTFDGISIPVGKLKLDNVEFTGIWNDYYFYNQQEAKNLKTMPDNSTGLGGTFLGWSDGVTTTDRAIIVNKNYDGVNALSANWKSHMASNTSGWVQSGMENFNGTEAVLYPSMNESWLHIEEIS